MSGISGRRLHDMEGEEGRGRGGKRERVLLEEGIGAMGARAEE